ncbi:CHRD domain-containing protein [Dyadobacter fermentans]|uniref:CHRD domain containing protein n=1 Tax=Dyadobacter fermentans (strain ATCC 700827 / DSM 18053 / CIP 107007 / KCTC 52180 / NS114) TaxID=471854 RepID=C6W072_DYAFD|nr:CHRD domain-containing protein [Dyadobacter fermentans]ACT91806.1 CHRD domain containing protein [Dyadobacter fermentans DSM 18053]
MLGFVTSCKEEGPHKDDIVKFSAVINSAPTVPKATSSAQGTGVFEYNKNTMELKYNVNFQNITPTSVTLNVANPAWERGPIIQTLSENPTGQVTGTVKLNTEQQTQLVVGMMYINVPTEQNPYGEIRGQIIADKFEE